MKISNKKILSAVYGSTHFSRGTPNIAASIDDNKKQILVNQG